MAENQTTTLIAVRIDVSMLNYSNIVEEVVYFHLQPLETWLKWVWYWEYLAARIKVKHPRRKVTLTMGNVDFFDKKLYIEKKKENLLRAKKAKLTKLMKNPIEDDLFGWASADNANAIAKVKKAIQELEDGAVNYYVPSEYINNIKEWI